MIVTTYFNLRVAIPALQKLFQHDFSSLKFLIKLKRLLDACEKEYSLFEESRMKLVQKYGEETQDENGNFIWKVKSENLQIFEKELQDVLQEKIELHVDKLDLKELEEASEKCEFKFSVFDLKSLEDFINE